MTWHVLDLGSPSMREFASALAQFVPSVNWAPAIRMTGSFEEWETEEEIADPPLRIRHFPLQRGYSRFPFSLLEDVGRRQTKRMLGQSHGSESSPLICTAAHYADVAECWEGPVIYYQTDLTIAYHGLDPKQVRSLDERLCQVATVVCPNSRRVAHYMIDEAGCDPGKIMVVPNATREQNIFKHPPAGPGPLPADVADLPRPVIGVLGNLAANLNWLLLLDAVEQTPEFSWVFVGPYEMDVYDVSHRKARERLLNWGGRVRFTGAKPYGELQAYARAIDAAVLPYRRMEPTYSGSSTRFYEHLAACRPMLATRGFEELLHKEPLLGLVDTAGELVGELQRLKMSGFVDGVEEERWRASQCGTWSMRAATLIRAVQLRFQGELPSKELPATTGEMLEAGRVPATPDEVFSLVISD